MTTDLSTTTMNPEEARRLTDEVKADAAALWLKLQRLYDGQAHLALGYPNWGAYFAAEFGQTGTRGYQLLAAGRVRELLADSTTVESLNEAQARELAPLLDEPEELLAVYREVQAAHAAGATAADLREAVRARRPIRVTFTRPPDEQGPPVVRHVGVTITTDAGPVRRLGLGTDAERDEADDEPPLPAYPDAVELPAVNTRQPLEDFLQALADAPRFGLLSYPPSLLAEATDAERATIRDGLAAVRQWLGQWETAR